MRAGGDAEVSAEAFSAPPRLEKKCLQLYCIWHEDVKTFQIR